MAAAESSREDRSNSSRHFVAETPTAFDSARDTAGSE